MDERVPAVGRDPTPDIDKTERPPWLREKGTLETVSKEPGYVLETKPCRERGKRRSDPPVDFTCKCVQIFGPKL